MRDKVDWQQLAVEEEEEEEDTVGPAMPGHETIGYMRATAAAEARAYNEMLSQMEAEEQAKVPKHEEWSGSHHPPRSSVRHHPPPPSKPSVQSMRAAARRRAPPRGGAG